MLPEEPIFKREFYEGIPLRVLNDTTCDVISHCLDSLNSIKSNEESETYAKEALELVKTRDREDLMKAGHIAGKAIEITGTNLLHSLSYPLTGHHEISHGTALGFYLKVLRDLYDFELDSGLSFLNSIVNPIVTMTEVDFNLMIDEAFDYSKSQESTLEISSADIKNRLKL
tara:strand:+ start:86 stop:598 length:513 start_codon:yes stop_codon:yes gene_type:complete